MRASLVYVALIAVIFDPCGGDLSDVPPLEMNADWLTYSCNSYGFKFDGEVEGWMSSDPGPVLTIYDRLDLCEDPPSGCYIERHPLSRTFAHRDPYTETWEEDLASVVDEDELEPGWTTLFACSDDPHLTYSVCAADYTVRSHVSCLFWGAAPDYWREVEGR